ncbi:hypothetical protein QQ045_017087 [Rhodiola kirilowii]
MKAKSQPRGFGPEMADLLATMNSGSGASKLGTVLWKEWVNMEIRSYWKSHVDMIVEMDQLFILTLFYGNPNSSLIYRSWDLLEYLSRNWVWPWIVFEDFHEVFFRWEAKGKVHREGYRMRRFGECAERCGLVDLGFSGSPFTFSNKRLFPYEAKARLDRVLGNHNLRQFFPNIGVLHGCAATSDYTPLVIKHNDSIGEERTRLFWYESMWHKHCC